MPLYVVLAKFTDKRMKNIKNLPKELEQAKQIMEAAGAEFKTILYTMGQYDIVVIAEAPNYEALLQVNLDYGREGLVRTETLKAFTPEEFINIIEKLS